MNIFKHLFPCIVLLFFITTGVYANDSDKKKYYDKNEKEYHQKKWDKKGKMMWIKKRKQGEFKIMGRSVSQHIVPIRCIITLFQNCMQRLLRNGVLKVEIK